MQIDDDNRLNDQSLEIGDYFNENFCNIRFKKFMLLLELDSETGEWYREKEFVKNPHQKCMRLGTRDIPQQHKHLLDKCKAMNLLPSIKKKNHKCMRSMIAAHCFTRSLLIWCFDSQTSVLRASSSYPSKSQLVHIFFYVLCGYLCPELTHQSLLCKDSRFLL